MLKAKIKLYAGIIIASFVAAASRHSTGWIGDLVGVVGEIDKTESL